MNNELMIFEGHELEILTKEDVNVDFNGTVLFNGKQVAEILKYANPSTAITEKVKPKYRIKLKNLDFVNHEFRKLNNAGENFITEKGVFTLIMQSNMPKAEEFEDKVWEIVTKVQQTGKYDSIEENIKQIEDDRERELTLKLYQLQNILKISPNDMITAISYRQTEQELKQYKYDLKLKEQEEILRLQNKKLKEQEEKLDNMFVIGDRVQFTNEVNRIARATGMQQSDIYSSTYKKLKSMYGIDLTARVRNKKEEIQNERINEGKKPYSPATLKSKVNALVIADELNIWNELGRGLSSLSNELLKKNEN